MSKTAALFPGQGSQSVGMGRDVVAAHRVARDVFDRASEVLGIDLAAKCFEGPADVIEATDVQQPAIFTTSVAIWHALREVAPDACGFAGMAGLSLGEYTALHLAGAMRFEDALRVVQRRGQLMQAAAEACPSGMVSLVGADEAQARQLCEVASSAGSIAPANFNCPGQIVVSGGLAACERILSLAEEGGFRAVALKVAGAFHSEFMRSAADGLREALDVIELRSPVVPVYANVNTEPHRDPATIREWLVEQLVSPVLWQATIEARIREGFGLFFEIGPGHILTGLMRRINRRMPVVNVSDAAGLESVKESV